MVKRVQPDNVRLVRVFVEDVAHQGNQIRLLFSDGIQQPTIAVTKLPPVQIGKKDNANRRSDFIRRDRITANGARIRGAKQFDSAQLTHKHKTDQYFFRWRFQKDENIFFMVFPFTLIPFR